MWPTDKLTPDSINQRYEFAQGQWYLSFLCDENSRKQIIAEETNYETYL